jgi:hypothetical protein
MSGTIHIAARVMRQGDDLLRLIGWDGVVLVARARMAEGGEGESEARFPALRPVYQVGVGASLPER